MDGRWYHNIVVPYVEADKISNSIFYELGYRYMYYDYRLRVEGELVGNLFDSCGLNFNTWSVEAFRDNVFLKNYRLVESQIDDRTYLTSEFTIKTPYSGINTMNPFCPVKNPETGSTYFVLQTPSILLAEDFAKRLGGSVVRLDDEAEKEFVLEYAKRYFAYNEDLQEYAWGRPCLNHLYIGFYGNEQGVTHVGEGDAADWLQVPANSSIPHIYTSYNKTQDDVVTTEAWMSSFYSGDSYWMGALFSKNPSSTDYRDRGVIIEIPGEITPLSVSLECDALTIPSNTVDYRVLASVYPKTDNYTLSWSSDNESVVTVSADGKLTATGLGTAKVTVTVDGSGLTASMMVVVTQYYAPESITDTTSEILLTAYQQTQKLSPVIAPAEATALLSYSSSDTCVAMVGMDGTVTALSSGTAVITAQVVGTELSISYTVKVVIAPTEIALKQDYIICGMDDEKKTVLSYSYSPAYATVGKVEYLSSDASVVTVSDRGELTPVGPGHAVVWISFPEIDRALQAKVIVVEDSHSLQIVRGEALGNWQGASVLYAEDGTTYLLLTESVFGNSKLPQKFPHKTKQVSAVGSNEWFYIDMENNLRYFSADSNGSNGEGALISEKVSHVWSSRWNGSRAYYQKADGTVWFYSNGTSVQNEWLEDVTRGIRHNGNYIFLDAQGTLWYDDTPEQNGEPLTALSFDSQPYAMDKKIVFLQENGCFDEAGTYYSFEYPNGELELVKNSEFDIERLTQTLKVTWDQVVDATYAFNSVTSHWLLLLADGRVVYAGYYYPGDTNMLSDLIDIPAYSGIGYCFLDLEDPIVSLGKGALIAEDGSVRTYITDYSAVLGNGKTYNNNRTQKRPVNPWFGMEDDGQGITVEKVTFTNGEGSTVTEEIQLQGLLQGLVDPASALRLALSKQAQKGTFQSILLKDGFGKKVEVEATLDRFGDVLVITPKSPLKAGYDYTLTIPANVMMDEFDNANRSFAFTFTVSGVAVYEVPVTGIVAESATEITLAYGESQLLDACVLPENASMQKVYWSSSDERVATVNPTGYVTGYYNGTATITATTADGGFTAVFTVKVSTAPESVSLSTGYFHLEIGETGKLEISSYPDYAHLGTLTYGSNNADVVTVDANGVLTAKALGSTLVYVTSSITGESYYALVDVVADTTSAEIKTVYRDGHHSDFAFFIAEDNTVWYVSTDSYGNGNTYLPRKANFKAKEVIKDPRYTMEVCYISMDGDLYRTNLFANETPFLIAEDVTTAAICGQHLFYLKSDGSVYHRHIEQGTTTKCTMLTGTTDLYLFDYNTVFFLSKTGEVRCATAQALNESLTNSAFKTVDIPTGEKILSMTRYYAVGEKGGLYRISEMNGERAATELTMITGNAEYQAIKEQIVEIVAADFHGNDGFVARMADGSVFYIGNASNLPVGLKNCVDTSNTTAENGAIIARPIQGIASVADLEIGYFVLSDGTVRAYQATNYQDGTTYKIMLANNNVQRQSYRMPVASWFGAQGDRTDILLQSGSAVAGDAVTPLTQGENLTEGVKMDSSFVFRFDKQLYAVTENVALVDIEGNLIPVMLSISGNTLTVTPAQALRGGMLYTLSISHNTVQDIFQNTTDILEFHFTTEGTLSLEVPVTGITDTVTQITLEYGEMQSLTPTVTPADATLPTVIWESSDKAVATVTQDGRVTGWRNGTATITAKTMDGGHTHTYQVTVSTAPESVSLSTGYFHLEIGETGKLEISSYPDYAHLGTLTYGSNNADVVTVDANGRLTAKALGSTLVYVTSSITGESYYALVDVVADTTSAEIKTVHGNQSNDTFFIAEDNTVWYITTNNYNNENVYLPRRAGFKAKEIVQDTYWSRIYYISTENQLYYTDCNMRNDWKTLVADDVASVVPRGEYIFYAKTDGSVYYYSSNLGKHTKCTLLTGTTEMYYWNNVFFFVKEGLLRYVKDSALADGIVNSAFKTVSIPNNEKILSMTHDYAIGENGGIYRVLYNDGEVTVSELISITQSAAYQSIKDQIAEITAADFNGNGGFIARMADGSVFYIGSGYEMPIGLKDRVDASDLSADHTTMIARPIRGLSSVVDLSTGYFVLADGTVRAYQATRYQGDTSYKIMLANNNLDRQNYRMPVVSWFGAQGEYADILLEKAEGVNGDAKVELSAGELAVQLGVDSSFVLTFDKQIFTVLDGISLIDMGGNLVPIKITISDRSLIITPKEPLKEGTLYTLSIPSGLVLDIFRNTTADLDFNFTTTGELHFAIPVTGITDTVGQLTLSYGDAQYLTPTIAPADASMKRVTWHSSNENVATVTQDGLVTGKQNGTATITVTTFDGSHSYAYTVTVYTPVESFTLSEEFLLLDLAEKKTAQLVGTVTPTYLENSGRFTWAVADPSIATVSADGTVTALKAGVTAVYCYCEGIDEPVVCVVSVLTDFADASIKHVSQKYDNGFLFEADGCLWMADANHLVPEKLVFQKPIVQEPAQGEGEGEQTAEATTAEILDISAMKQVLYVPAYRYGSDANSFLILFLEEDGTLLFYSSLQKEAPILTKENVQKIAYANDCLVLLLNDGTLRKISTHGVYSQEEGMPLQLNYQEDEVQDIAGIQDIVYSDFDNSLFLLQINKGLVWRYDPNGGYLQLVFNKEPITDITVGNGSFMLGESGVYYPLRGNPENCESVFNELKNHDFYKLNLELADVVRLRYDLDLLMLTKDGKLAYFGQYASSCPLAAQYSGYTWTRDSVNPYLHYIDTGKAIAEIGCNWIVFTDGTVQMFGEYEYFGNAKPSNNYQESLCSPYFTETEIDIHSLILNKVLVGETEIDITDPQAPVVDPATTITLEFSLPLLPTDLLLATTVTDSKGNYPAFEIRVEGRRILLIFEEPLTAGETYTVTVYEDAAQDIFYNEGDRIDFTVTINNTAAEVQSYKDSLYPTTEYSPDWSLKQLQAALREYYDEVLHEYIVENSKDVGNAFLNAFANPDTTSWMDLKAEQSYNQIGSLIGNFWGTTKTDLIDRIIYDVNDSFNYGEILYDPILTAPSETAYPFVTSIVVKNSEGNIVSSVGLEEITIEVSFNRDMDTAVQPMVAYGSDYPFGDFAVEGDWKDARTWVGTTKISAVTGSGTQFFKVRGAVAADDSWLVTGNDYERFAFTIATSGAKSMSMQANGADGYVSLEWTQDDYETLAGYNVYRSELMDGTYRKINTTLISQGVTSFVDDNVAPGVQYYYYFTVVGTDLKESEPSGVAMASAQDTTPPVLSHAAVNQAPQGAAISIVANVYDNLGVSFVNLYYRVKGTTEYSCVPMYGGAGTSNRYTATIPAGVVTEAGVEYYIEASDGRQSATMYSAASPRSIRTYEVYTITVVSVSGGRIVVSKTRAKAGDYITAEALADAGYAYLAESLKYSVDGTEHIVENGGFVMPSDNVVITATFVEESIYAYGDINRDGAVNSADAILLLRYDAGLETLDQEQQLLADVNRDGRVTVIDANEILRIDVGL
ncbi:MAG: Ig-like domain-containing protein [Clostridia bacterium]|nr:Ig-like domain-containing protein [Clostridia bacterium]